MQFDIILLCCTAWWLYATILGLSVLAQPSPDWQESCYNLTTTTHCFRTARDSDELLKTFAEASRWCADQGYILARVDRPEVQTVLERFIQEFELTSDDVWIGANRSWTPGQWTWVNGDVFADGVPNLFIYLFIYLCID